MPPKIRTAGPDDAEEIARLHAESWRRHYRGAYADSFLDNEVDDDRRLVWSARLAEADRCTTLVAVGDSVSGGSVSGGSVSGGSVSGGSVSGATVIVGFIHVIFDHDDEWGSLVDNLHVRYGCQRRGIGTGLMASAAEAVAKLSLSQSMYLWVLEQNVAAQAFYRALGGVDVGTARVPPPGGVPARLSGSPSKIRIAWRDVSSLVRAADGRP